MLKSTKAAREARQRQELYRMKLARDTAALAPPVPEGGFVGQRAGHFVHYCRCGAWGAFGYGARGGKLGTWYCAEHRPTETSRDGVEPNGIEPNGIEPNGVEIREEEGFRSG